LLVGLVVVVGLVEVAALVDLEQELLFLLRLALLTP
jgi:hypothetical protein